MGQDEYEQLKALPYLLVLYFFLNKEKTKQMVNSGGKDDFPTL